MIKAPSIRTKTDQTRALRALCIGPLPLGGRGGHRERLLKNYIFKVAKVLPNRAAR